MAKAAAIRKGKPFCAACHKRLSRPVPCRVCGKTVKVHADEEPVCKSCAAKGRTCLRCCKPIIKAGLTVDGGVVCSPCARHYTEPKPCAICGAMSRRLARSSWLGFTDPACPRCLRVGHKTCAVCGKHRLPAGKDGQGRPLCKKCLDSASTPFICPACGKPGKRHSSTKCEACYWQERLAREIDGLAGRLSSARLISALPGYSKYLSERCGSRAGTRRLRHHAGFFEALDQEPLLMDDSDLLLERFGADGLRRYALPYGYLAEAGVLEKPDTDDVVSHCQDRQQQAILSRQRPEWAARLLVSYHDYLTRLQAKLRARGWHGEYERLGDRTVTGYLRGAANLLDSLPDGLVGIQQLDQILLDRYLVAHPGRRNPLLRFVRYLNRQGKLFAKLQLAHLRRPLAQLNDLLGPEQQNLLLHEWLYGQFQPGHALLLLFMLLYAQPIERLVRMTWSQVTPDGNGGYCIRFAKTPLTLPPEIVGLVGKHAEAMSRKAHPVSGDAWLFPGRMPGSHMTEAAVTNLLNREGVTQSQLFTTAMVSSYLYGAQIPKSLVYAFGISAVTAVNYYALLSSRLADELAMHHQHDQKLPHRKRKM